MACNHNNINCGCKDTYLTTPPPCPTPADCPDPQPCSEVFDAQCIVYTGADILCGQDTVVTQNDSVAEALASVVDYFCDEVATSTVITADIFCQESPQVNTLVVPEDTLVNTAVALVVEYFCDRFSNLNLWLTIEADTGSTSADNPTDTLTIVGGDDISTTIVGDTLTINHTGVKKYTDDYTSVAGTTIITHNLNTLDLVVSIRQNFIPFAAYSQGLGQDYTYTIDNPNTISVTDYTGMAAVVITVIG